MINMCLDWRLPEPLFEYVSGDFVVTFRKYRITEDIIEKLNHRQKKAIEFLKKHGKITLKDYKNLQPILTEKTAYRDLKDMEGKNIIKAVGEKKGRYYVLV